MGVAPLGKAAGLPSLVDGQTTRTAPATAHRRQRPEELDPCRLSASPPDRRLKMSTSLDAWQERLDRHFAALAASRPVTHFPIFAFEHGCDQPELSEIVDLLRARLAAGYPAHQHWLLWVVYATEFGYRYYGDEYWHSYEEETPHWRISVTRDELRSWFLRFQRSYHGVIPSGPWAEHFSIIAWPITHAILPKYLQLQFAEALYAIRHRLARLETLSAPALGQLLANSAWNGSSRFREFLQQQELA